MRVLAIDTALGACSAAVLDAATDALVAVESVEMPRGHAEALMPMVARVAEAAGGLEDVARVAVCVGPGSFTGLRVGIAAARGIGLALSIPVVGVTTLAALVAPIATVSDMVPVAAAIDARHAHVYFQMFAPGGRSLVSARCVSARDAARSAGIGPVHIIGDGAPMVVEAGAAMGSTFDVAGTPVAPDIGWIARLGAVADPVGMPPHPAYLKPVDAKPQDLARLVRREA